MRKNRKEKKLSEQRLQKAATLYKQLTEGLSYLKAADKNIKQIKKDYKNLSEYYERQWMRDVDVVKNLNTDQASYKEIINQDSIWDLIVKLDKVLKSK